MKLSKNLLLWGVVFSLTSGSLSALADGVGSGGGGDSCKNEIDKDRQAILNWITNGDAKDLDFSKAQVPGWTFDSPPPAKSYKASMLSVLQPGKVVVTCFLDPARINDPAAQKIVATEGVSYKAVTIGNPPEPTTCINYEDENQVSHIDCNYDLIMAKSSTGNPDYVTVHHEFDSIAGVEKRTNSFVSDFSVSNQISDYEHWETIAFLGPKNDTHSKTPTDVSWSAPTRTMADGSLYFDWPILYYIDPTTHSFSIWNGQNLLPNHDTAQGFCTIIHKSLVDFGKGSGGSEFNTVLNTDGSFQAKIGGGNPMSYVICK